MVVLINLPECLTDFQVRFIIIHPMILGAVNRDTAVGAFKVGMGGRSTGARDGAFARLRVVRGYRHTGLLVARMRAECILFDKRRTLSDGWGRGFRKVVE
jgi:hypothetical protein